MKTPLILWISLLLAWGGLCAQEVDQTSAPVGQFLDPDNLENISKIQGAASTAKDAKKGADLVKEGKYKEMVTDQFTKYQNSKVGLMNIIRNVQKKAHKVITVVSDRVDKWRTTVPKIRSYTQRVVQYADDSYSFAQSFEMSDIWDIDRDFSKELEFRVKRGSRLGLSIWDFLISRIESEDFLQGLERLLFPDYQADLGKTALGGFNYHDDPSKSDKVPIFVLNECLNTMGVVKEISEGQLSPHPDAPALTRQQYDNRRIRQALFSPSSGYTDQVALRNDILNKQYETATQRSILKDKIAYLELLWGQVAAQKIERKELQTAAAARELSTLVNLELDPDTWTFEKFGLEDAP